MQVASGGVLAGNAVVNILLAGSLNQIWSMINNLQIAIHSPLINVQFPGNAFMIYEVMITVATFDILPTDDFYPYFFPSLPERDAFSDKFDRLEYGSYYIIMNMGTMLLVFFWYLLMFMIYPVADFLKNDANWARRVYNKLRPILIWNGSILFI